MGQNSNIQAPLFEAFKLPRLKLPSSLGSCMKQYHMKLIRLSEACPRIPGGYPFIYRLLLARGYPRSDGYVFLYRLLLARGYPRLAMFFYTVCSSPEAIHGLHLDPPLPSLRRHTFTA